MNRQVFFEKVIIITGASSGIGRHLALRLAEQGAYFALAARKSGASPNACAGIIIKAVEKRKRYVVMTFEGKAGLWLRLIVPKLLDQILKNKTDQ